MRTRHHRRSRGFVLIMAIMILGLMGVTLAILTRHFAYDASRTRQTFEDAQLRQLLLAGAQDVAIRSADWNDSAPKANWTLDLPPELKAESATVSVQPQKADSDGTTLLIEARLGTRSAVQTLRLERKTDRWIITDARLGAEPE